MEEVTFKERPALLDPPWGKSFFTHKFLEPFTTGCPGGRQYRQVRG